MSEQIRAPWNVPWSKWTNDADTGYAYPAFVAPLYRHEPASEELVLERTTKTGGALHIHLRRWNDKMWRSKKGYNMHDKPLDILYAEVRDAQSGKPLYKNPLWLGMTGIRKDEVSTEMFYGSYRHRKSLLGIWVSREKSSIF